MFSYQKSFVNPTLPVDEAQFWALVRATQWNENIDKFRETGDAQLKRKLPAFIFQATFDVTTSKSGKTGAWRKQAATHLTGLVVMDVDHIENPLTLFQGWVEKGLDWKQLGILLIYITPSGKGLKIVFKADAQKGNLIDNQHAMAEVLGVESARNRIFCIWIRSCLRMRTRSLLRNTMLSIGLVIVLTLRLLLWPVRVLNKGLCLLGMWMIRRWN